MPDVGGIAGEQLRSFIERIERLEEEKRSLSTDIKEVYSEAKGGGFDVKIMRLLVKERRMDKDDIDEQEMLIDLYRRALGGWSGTPLGRVAERLVNDIKKGTTDIKFGDDPWMSEQIAANEAKRTEAAE